MSEQPQDQGSVLNEHHYDRHLSVQFSEFDCALEVTVWKDGTAIRDRVVRIPVEEIPDFLSSVTANGLAALSVAARRLEVGHCETCGNTGLIHDTRHGQPWSEYCPDCKDRWPDKPFRSAPEIGYRNVQGEVVGE